MLYTNQYKEKSFSLAKIIWFIIAYLQSTFLNLKTGHYVREQNV